MRLSRPGALLVVLAIVVGATGGACGDTPGVTPDASAPLDATTDATPDGATPVDATADVSTDRDAPDAGPARAPFGLDTRPPNPTCRLPNRPTATQRGLRLTRVFANARLDQPMAMAQIPAIARVSSSSSATEGSSR